MWFSFVVFGKSEEAEISDGHLSDFLGVLGSEISFPAYTGLVLENINFFLKKCHIFTKDSFLGFKGENQQNG